MFGSNAKCLSLDLLLNINGTLKWLHIVLELNLIYFSTSMTKVTEGLKWVCFKNFVKFLWRRNLFILIKRVFT